MRSFRNGDTLVEVTLATGIFSLVAISVVSVVSVTTSSSQSALEVTLTREEMDAQAEAIRFIHSSYVAAGADNSSTLNKKYADFWKAITQKAVILSDPGNNDVISFLNDNSGACSDIYNDSTTYGGIFQNYAFIINTHQMGLASTTNGDNWGSGNADKVVIRPSNDASNVFYSATTYPHIFYGNNPSDNTLYDQTATQADNIYRAEGVYIMAVRDNDSTSIVQNGATNPIEKHSAYYDFYIRTCWYTPGADNPSTISTVIRLVDPNAIDYSRGTPVPPPDTPSLKRYTLAYDANGGIGAPGEQSCTTSGTSCSVTIQNATLTRDGYTFDGWSTSPSGNATISGGDSLALTSDSTTIYAIWRENPTAFTLSLNLRNGEDDVEFTCEPLAGASSCQITIPSSNYSVRNHYLFGFTENSNLARISDAEYKIDTPDSPVTVEISSNTTIYAVWAPNNDDPPPADGDEGWPFH